MNASTFTPQRYRQAPRPNDLNRHFLRLHVEAALVGALDPGAVAGDLADIAAEVAAERNGFRDD
jgi:hypothetical protein